ncbi:VC0807 family protein [Fictibacillus barbaricus]|uniref:Intracellular septation protein A n=1 Tax=Fictibacillus barbaricus TaxID=182136 RepID=A0ABU1TX08_9BACL|nr:VC0807 family protein [Fictibacillus barbaricus]MDR7071705.1 hypothetical protein [Fictibacillus barbaricus]
MHKNIVVWDLICYVIFPLLIWNFSRDYISDYYAMLISSVPGIIYSIIRFILLKKINLLGIFMIANLSLGTLIDVLSGSAIRMLWNNVFFSYAFALFFIITIMMNKPIYLFFSLDVVEMQGHNRDKMKKLFYQSKTLTIFKLITLGFAFREVLLASIKVWLIMKYGVDAFDKGIILRQVLNWTITGISIYGFIHISKMLNESKPNEKPNDPFIQK